MGSSAAHLTVSLDLCSNGETYEAGFEALEGCGVDSESPSRVLDKTNMRKFQEGTKENILPCVVIDSRQINDSQCAFLETRNVQKFL